MLPGNQGTGTSTGRHSTTSGLGTSIGQQANLQGGILGVNPTSLINTLNALIAADITRDWLLVEQWMQTNGPLILIGVILVIVMLLAAYEFIK